MKPWHILCASFIGLTLFAIGPREAVAGSITLTIGSPTITFPSANPDTTSTIAASENPISISVDYPSTGTWVVTMSATSDLIGPSGTIPISNIHFVGTGVADASGTLSDSSEVTLATGGFTSVPEIGTLSFYFDNSWDYPAGTYSTSVVITAMSL